MNNQEYSIKETLNILNISRTTLYTKIDKYKKELNPHITSKNGKKYISHDGIEILRSPNNIDSETNNCTDYVDNEVDSCTDISDNINTSGYIEIISLLKSQLEDKNGQIQDLQKDKENLYQELSEQRKLHENTQVLLQNSQQKILYIEQIKEKEQPWWKKLFN